jgi:hypothetical protein
VSRRDGERCTFVGEGGRRCAERGFLEFHHVMPFAVGGLSTVANLALRCAAHNRYEAALYYGGNKGSGAGVVREAQLAWEPQRPSPLNSPRGELSVGGSSLADPALRASHLQLSASGSTEASGRRALR